MKAETTEFREAIMLEVTVLAVPDCPNEPVLRDRLAQVLPDYPDATVTRKVIQDEAGAARHGMHGSPTLLVNGSDPFAARLARLPASPAACTAIRAGRPGAPRRLRRCVRRSGVPPATRSPPGWRRLPPRTGSAARR